MDLNGLQLNKLQIQIQRTKIHKNHNYSILTYFFLSKTAIFSIVMFFFNLHNYWQLTFWVVTIFFCRYAIHAFTCQLFSTFGIIGMFTRVKMIGQNYIFYVITYRHIQQLPSDFSRSVESILPTWHASTVLLDPGKQKKRKQGSLKKPYFIDILHILYAKRAITDLISCKRPDRLIPRLSGFSVKLARVSL